MSETCKLAISSPAFSVLEATGGICLSTSRARRLLCILD